jgi:hypothetical protein
MAVMRRHAIALLLCAAHACGDDLGTGDGGGADDGADAPDAGDPVAIRCRLSLGCPAWIEEYEREVVAVLAGEQPIDGEVALVGRSSNRDRELTRAYLAAELARSGLEPQLHEYGGGGANVYAALPATGDGERMIVVGAHMDAVDGAPGAADNASGVAMVLAAARYLSELERRDQAVMFALFDQEELGLVGSLAFALRLRIDGALVDGMHNFDMLSWDQDDDRGVELWSPDEALEPFYLDAAAEIGMPVAAHELLNSDHGAFKAHGFRAIGMGEEFHEGDTTPFYHQPGDRYDQVDFGYLAAATQLALRAIERQLGVASSPK